MISRRLLRIKVLKILFAYIESNNKLQLAAEKELMFSIKKTYDLYHCILLLLVDIADFASNKIEIGRQKFLPTSEEKNPNTRFVDNAVIHLLRQNKALQNYVNKEKLSWADSHELIKKIFVNIHESDYYKEYMAGQKQSFAEDKKLVCSILQLEFEDLDLLNDIIEEKNIYWTDDLGFVLSMAIKTVKTFRANQDNYTELLPLYKDESDNSFALRLFRRTLADYDKNQEIIEKYTKNWDLERLAIMDILILQMTLAEVCEFPEIPINISIDEYIEISKYFSSPASGAFVNGVADKIINNELKENYIAKREINL